MILLPEKMGIQSRNLDERPFVFFNGTIKVLVAKPRCLVSIKLSNAVNKSEMIVVVRWFLKCSLQDSTTQLALVFLCRENWNRFALKP